MTMQIIPIVDMTNADLIALWSKVEAAWSDGPVTDEAKDECRAHYEPVRLMGQCAALGQQVGIRAMRGGRIDKNLMTQLRDLEKLYDEARSRRNESRLERLEPVEAIEERQAA